MNFCPERLIEVRTSLNINKAEAARRLNISAMAYGRYEKGEREPSYQSVCFIAQTFHCNIDFLYGISDDMKADYIIVSRSKSPELYSLLLEIHENRDMKDRILAYARKLAPTMGKDQSIVITISGRGDKDCAAIARYKGEDLHE